MKMGLSFDDVLLVPKYSGLESRSSVSLQSDWIAGWTLRMPILSSPMDTVTDLRMMKTMSSEHCLGVHHRYTDDETLIKSAAWGGLAISPSMGMEFIDKLANVNFPSQVLLVLDVAHGDSIKCFRFVDMIKKKYRKFVVASGNIVTAEAARRYEDVGVDMLRVGVGGGSACSTRVIAGVGVPTFTAIHDIREVTKLPIIADGGMRNSGDIVKALAIGANFVILGKLLAAAQEAPGKRRTRRLPCYEYDFRYDDDREGPRWIYPNTMREKEFRGMASAEALDEAGKERNIEGVATWIEEVGPVAQILDGLERGIRAGFAYLGARNIQELRDKSEFIQITHAGYIEGLPKT